MRLLIFLAFGLLPGWAWAESCHADIACPLGDRSYHVLEPDGWDGVSPLPVMLHFHGWGRQGTLIVKHQRISGATRRRGVLLLAPNGQGRTWNFWGSGGGDVDFAARVIEDAAQRYPIDRDRIYVSGYSFGSAMAWRFACERGNGVAALFAVAGSIDQDTDCTQMPREVRHVHGTTDTVMRFPFGPEGSHYGPVRLWRRMAGCKAPSDKAEWRPTPPLRIERTVWSTCAAPARITLDVHGGGHFIPRGWIARQLDEMLERPFSYP